MALRVKIELVPHGTEAGATVLDEIVIANNGTGIRGGPNEGGVGNYDVYDGHTLKELHTMDEPRSARTAEVRGIPRTPNHRLEVARRALQAVEQERKNRRPA